MQKLIKNPRWWITPNKWSKRIGIALIGLLLLGFYSQAITANEVAKREGLEAQVASLKTELADTKAALAESEAALAESEEALAEAEAALEEALAEEEPVEDPPPPVVQPPPPPAEPMDVPNVNPGGGGGDGFEIPGRQCIGKGIFRICS